MSTYFLNNLEDQNLFTSITGGSITQNESEQENIYEYLTTTNLNSHLMKKKAFILKPHQVIPKYYLLNHVDKLILHYSMGSGKTAAAIYILNHYYETYMKQKFLNLYSNTHFKSNKNIYIIGTWQTQNAFLQDLMKPEFHFIDKQILEEIDKKRNSNFKEIRQEGELEYKKISKQLLNNFEFYGYQALFNVCFPNIENKHFVQDASMLIDEFNKGILQIDENVLINFKNSIIIIDEMQRLYSSQGLNSYGFIIGALIKKTKKYNTKFVFLTGTMLNLSLYEVVDVMNILNDETFEPHSKYLDEITILDDIHTYKIKDSQIDYIRNYFNKHFIFYEQSSNKNEINVKISKDNSELNKKFMFYDPVKKIKSKDTLNTIYSINNVKKLIYENDKSSNLPTEIHIGNLQLKEKQIMNLYCVTVEGKQAELYKKYLTENITMKNLDDDTVTTTLHDGAFDKKDDLLYSVGGIYSGSGLKYPHVKQYSAIGAEMVRLTLYNTILGEKTVIYHEKILNFGLKQYAEILNQNGFILYGTSPKNDTRCKICGLEFENHKTGHDFIPMRYGILYGDMSENERKDLTQLYNSANNLYGDYISVMFISSIAYSGVSFFNTNNLIILDKINNLSKWKQICSRIIRTHSHDLLPKEKKIAKIYTMIIRHPDEYSNGSTKFYFEEKYYKLRLILNDYISNFIEDITKHSITDILLYNQKEIPKILTLKKELTIFKNDLIKELKFIFENNRLDCNSPWLFKHLFDRLQDPENQMSYINMSLLDRRKNLFSTIIRKHFINLFYDKFDYNDTKNIYCIVNVKKEIKENNVNNQYTTLFNFSDLNYLLIENNQYSQDLINLSILIEKVKTINNNDDDKHIISIRNNLNSLLNKITNLKLIVNNKTFWEAIYLIHDEYYSDDDRHFIKNHSKENRNFHKIAGFYYYDTIILKPKEIDLINDIYPETLNQNIEKIKIQKKEINQELFEGTPYIFKIISNNNIEPSIWYLRVTILEPNDHIDNRRKNKGINCVSFDVKKLKIYFSDLNYDINKKTYCIKLISDLCSIANKKNISIVTPFNN